MGVFKGTAGGLRVDEKLIIEYKMKINRGYTIDQNKTEIKIKPVIHFIYAFA